MLKPFLEACGNNLFQFSRAPVYDNLMSCYVNKFLLSVGPTFGSTSTGDVAILTQQLKEMAKEKQGHDKEVEGLRQQLEEMSKEKKELLIKHSREVVGLRHKTSDLRIIKQRNEVLEADLKAEKSKTKEKTAELEKERMKRRSAEKNLKELQSQMAGKSVKELEEERNRRRKLAELKRGDFLKKHQTEGEESMKGKARDVLDQDQGVVVEKTPSKRPRLENEKRVKGRREDEINKEQLMAKGKYVPEVEKKRQEKEQHQGGQSGILARGKSVTEKTTGDKLVKSIIIYRSHFIKNFNLLLSAGEKKDIRVGVKSGLRAGKDAGPERVEVKKRLIQCAGCAEKV